MKFKLIDIRRKCEQTKYLAHFHCFALGVLSILEIIDSGTRICRVELYILTISPTLEHS